MSGNSTEVHTGSSAGEHKLSALPAEAYDGQWSLLSDFIRFHPGARHRRRLIMKIARTLEFRRLLDVGCGPGELIHLFRQSGIPCELTGCDLSPQVIARNRQRFPDVDFHVQDIVDGHLPDQFDLVVSSEMIEHVADQPRAFENIARMVAPGGHLLLTCPTGRIYPTEIHFGHVHHPTLDELRAMATANGLQSLLEWNWGWPTYRALKFFTNVNSEWAIEHFADRDYTLPARLVSHLLYLANFLNIRSRYGVSLFALYRRDA